MKRVISIAMAAACLTLPAMAEDTPSVTPDETAVVATVDYSQMENFMERLSSNERGRPAIAYNLLRKDSLPFFDEYEAYLTSIDETALSEDDRLAYWLNLQNFLVVKAVTQDTKKKSLKSLRGTAAKPGKMWTKDRVTIGGQSYSIAKIEAKITSEFNNPNVIYGLYQGVKGGPCLSQTPYDGETINSRLAELGMQYVNSRGIVYPSKGVVSVTPIYDWHKAALFNDDDKVILKHLKQHASTQLRGRLNTGREIKFTKLNYATDDYVAAKPSKRRSTQRQRPAPTSTPAPRPSGGSYGS